MSPSTRVKVENFAFYSRILVFLVQIIFNFVIPDHDAKVFNPPKVHRTKTLDYYAELLFEGFKRWDGIYFHHVAEHGYTYENTLAFFPLFPFVVRILANTVFYPLQFMFNYGIVLTISAYVFNFFVFVKSASVLYDLTLLVLKDETLAFKASLLYSINPASIFFSAVYSETLFAFLAFKGMVYSERNRLVRCSILFGISGLTRSNGLVNIGFIVYRKFIDAIDIMKSVYNTQFINIGSKLLANVTYLLILTLHLALQIAFCVIPYILYQFYAYTVFCDKNASYKDLKVHILNYGNNQGYKMPHTGLSPWCFNKYPFSYQYVQEVHWNVGFMRYWEFKQIPNFILATPIALLSISAILSFIRRNILHCLTLGIYKPRDVSHYKKFDEVPKQAGFHQHCVFVYVVHLAFLLLFGIFFMHIQVLTRFICSSSPVVYWYIAHLTTPAEKLSPLSESKHSIATSNSPHLSSHSDMHETDVHSDHQTPNGGADSNNPNQPQSSISSSLQQQQQNGSSYKETNSDTADKIPECGEFCMQDLDDMYDWDSISWLHRLIFIYMHLYFFVGIAAFANFLPWT